MKLIFKGSKDINKFHKNCDGIENTLIVMKSEFDQLFGGYTDIKWDTLNNYTYGNGNSFLFSLTKNTKHRCKE